MKIAIPKFVMFVVGLLPLTIHSQAKNFTFGQLDSLQRVEKRIAVAFIHTDWCGYCQAMKRTTFKGEVEKLLERHYWFIELNAEEKGTIFFNGKTYGFKPRGNNVGTHGLVEEFTARDERISYPMILFFDPDHRILFRYDQFISGADFLNLLKEMKRFTF